MLLNYLLSLDLAAAGLERRALKGELIFKVVVFGAAGKMGSTVVKAVTEDSQLQLVGAIDTNNRNADAGVVAGIGEIGVKIENSADSLEDADISVDFTSPDSVEKNVVTVLEKESHAVVGTTGLTVEAISRIKEKSQATGKNVFIAPNFAIGAVLMMELAKKAAKHMDNVEIIELHHDQKLDAPSGTALKTAKELAEIINPDCPPTAQIGTAPSLDFKEKENIAGSRGGCLNNIRIHSVRLPGLVAHQEIIFGAKGQTLTIRHDSIDRVSFMPGVIKAIKAVGNLPGITIGLENILKI